MHVREPGLVVLDITAQDEETAVAVMSRLNELWAWRVRSSPRRAAGRPGRGACGPGPAIMRRYA
ncbi:DUF6207 family protein [Streptomyces iranensis]|uniref:DUF6207 family protein n=1 Tax=Streptomyces iranensis TaxID=576784 RepID=UPI0027E38ECA|nr:DUF6207 family protein [Streptomyces iranensis]